MQIFKTSILKNLIYFSDDIHICFTSPNFVQQHDSSVGEMGYYLHPRRVMLVGYEWLRFSLHASCLL